MHSFLQFTSSGTLIRESGFGGGVGGGGVQLLDYSLPHCAMHMILETGSLQV